MTVFEEEQHGTNKNAYLAENMRMRKILMLITYVRVKIQLNMVKLIRTFIGQFLKDNSMGLIKIHNGGNYAHVQDSNAYKGESPLRRSSEKFAAPHTQYVSLRNLFFNCACGAAIILYIIIYSGNQNNIFF